MECRRCQTRLPDVAHYCHRCGQDMRTADESRKQHFALKPDEPVASFNIVSTIMPRGAGERPQTYRTALVIALAAALLASIFGALPIAVIIAAFAIPLVYIIYLYDVNLWKDAPVPVTGMAFVLTGVLSVLFLVAVRSLLPGAVGVGGALSVAGLLVAVILIPVIGELIRQIGPVFLASRPAFDDLMDGLTFGIVAGVAYSTADTLVRHWSLLTGGFVADGDVGLWIFLVVLEGFIKPLIIGTASGIAGAEFSGLGRGYDGFSMRYLRGIGEAILANAVYNLGISLAAAYIDNGAAQYAVQVLIGLIVLGVLILRIRGILHTGLMEAALEATAREGVGATEGVGAQGDLDFCPRCEMPLLAHSTFCNACGAAVHEAGRRASGRGPGAGTAVPSSAGATGDSTTGATDGQVQQ